MREYQDQIKRWWDFEVKFDEAIKIRMWLEAISLAYVLLELRMRLVLRVKKVDRREIDKQKYVATLVEYAISNGHMEKALGDRILEFNQIRRQAIHGLMQGKIGYDDLQRAARIYSTLTLPLQEAMGVKITLGPVETYEDYLKKQRGRNR